MMKKLVIDSSIESDAIYDQISKNGSRLQKSQQSLSEMFQGDDIMNGIKGFHEEESNQLSKEIFASLFENSHKVESQKSWAKAIFDAIENSEMYTRMKKHCLHNQDKSAIATVRLINEIGLLAKDLRTKQQQEQIDFDDPDLEIDFDESEVEDLKDLLDLMVPQAVESFNKDDELGKMLGIGHDMSKASPEKGKSIGKNLLDSVKRNEILLEIFNKAGSLLEAMDNKKVKDKNVIENIIGIKQGRNLNYLTTTSKSLLCNPITETVFYDKFCRNQLDIFDYEGETDKSRGPIMLLIDESGSMNTLSRSSIASALGVAFTHLAITEGRPITIIGFNSTVTNVFQVKDKKCISNRKEVALVDLLMELATRQPSGGTNFDDPINKALSLNSNEEKADLIIVTDGHAPISDNTIERLNKYKKEDLKLYSILLGCNPSVLEKISDEIVDIEKLSSPNKKNSIGSIMNQVKSAS